MQSCGSEGDMILTTASGDIPGAVCCFYSICFLDCLLFIDEKDDVLIILCMFVG